MFEWVCHLIVLNSVESHIKSFLPYWIKWKGIVLLSLNKMAWLLVDQSKVCTVSLYFMLSLYYNAIYLKYKRNLLATLYVKDLCYMVREEIFWILPKQLDRKQY